MADQKPESLVPPGEGLEFESVDESLEEFVEAQLGMDVLAAFGKKSVGRRASKPQLYFEVSRELTIDDALVMQEAPSRKVGEAGGTPSVQSLRTIHHQIARMLAMGEKQVSIARALGITPARIQQLLNDPTFMELQAHYEDLDHKAEVSIKERFYLLGTVAMEELQERLLDAPDSFGNGHLMELTKLTVGGEAPKTNPAPKGAQVLDEATVKRLKAQADGNQKGNVSIREEVEVKGEQTSED